MFALYIALITGLLAYAQLALKWRLGILPALPAEGLVRYQSLLRSLFDPVVLSCALAIGLASLLYLSILAKYNLNRVYPFMALNFVLVVLGSSFFLGEPLSFVKVAGVLLIVAGVSLAAQG